MWCAAKCPVMSSNQTPLIPAGPQNHGSMEWSSTNHDQFKGHSTYASCCFPNNVVKGITRIQHSEWQVKEEPAQSILYWYPEHSGTGSADPGTSCFSCSTCYQCLKAQVKLLLLSTKGNRWNDEDFSLFDGQFQIIEPVGVKARRKQVCLRQWCRIRLLKAGRGVSWRHPN